MVLVDTFEEEEEKELTNTYRTHQKVEEPDEPI
jgi:hypothetical protein